jgi:hypothetical protein
MAKRATPVTAKDALKQAADIDEAAPVAASTEPARAPKGTKPVDLCVNGESRRVFVKR